MELKGLPRGGQRFSSSKLEVSIKRTCFEEGGTRSIGAMGEGASRNSGRGTMTGKSLDEGSEAGSSGESRNLMCPPSMSQVREGILRKGVEVSPSET